MQVLLDALMAVSLLAPPSAMPVEYMATSPLADSLSYDPARGWVSATECPRGCYVPAGVPIQLLVGEIDLQTLADWQVTIRRDGVEVASFWVMPFGGQAVYTTRP